MRKIISYNNNNIRTNNVYKYITYEFWLAHYEILFLNSLVRWHPDEDTKAEHVKTVEPLDYDQ